MLLRVGNLNEEVDAENLASFLGLTNSWQDLGPCTVRVQLHPSTGLCLGHAIVCVPESRGKRLLAHNGRSVLCCEASVIDFKENQWFKFFLPKFKILNFLLFTL